MGCDIHLRVERRDDSGRWQDVKAPENWNNRACDDTTPRGEHYYGHWFEDRNYHLFTALADVRNDGLMLPLFKPRGLPDDVATKEDTESDDGWWWGDHSHSWLTVAEIEPYLRSVVVPYTGIVDVEEYDRWKESGDIFPKDWCGGISGPRIVLCEEGQLFMSRGGGAGGFQIMPKATHVSAKWAARGDQAFERFLRLCDYVKRYGKPEDVRFVFGFDS